MGGDAETKKVLDRWRCNGEMKGSKQNIFEREVLPVNKAKVLLQVFWFDVALAQLQLSSRVVVNVVNTHFLHDAKTSLLGHKRFGLRSRKV